LPVRQRAEASPTKIVVIVAKDQRFIRHSDDIPSNELVSMGFYEDLSSDAPAPIGVNLSDEAADIPLPSQWLSSWSATHGQRNQRGEQPGQYQ
jgi:hypothetical protein